MSSSFHEIRFHGRGGQGSVSAAALLALAVFESGFQTQAFPKFGSERRGAPVEAYVRISHSLIRTHTQIYTPDVLIIQDASLISAASALQGLKPSGLIVINSHLDDLENFQKDNDYHWICLPASQIGQTHLGRPLPNTALLGAFASVSDYVSLASLRKSISHHLSAKGESVVQGNILALEEGYQCAQQAVSI